MREFTDFEKQIIEKMVSAKDVQGSSLVKLIDENTDAIALEWNIDEPSFMIIYRPSILSDDDLFNQIQEIVFLLKSLEESNLIYLHQNEKFNQDNCLYNRVKYKRENPREYSIIVNIPKSKGHILTNYFEVKTDFGRYVERYAISLFYASNALHDLVKNKFKTPEQRRHKTMLLWTRAAFLVALISSFITASDVVYNWSRADGKSLRNQIKQTIEQKTLPDVIKTEITNDTLTTRIIVMPEIQSTKQSK